MVRKDHGSKTPNPDSHGTGPLVSCRTHLELDRIPNLALNSERDHSTVISLVPQRVAK